jgi:hypothetical protein
MPYDYRTKAGNESAIVRHPALAAALRGKRHKAAVEGNRDAIERNAP